DRAAGADAGIPVARVRPGAVPGSECDFHSTPFSLARFRRWESHPDPGLKPAQPRRRAISEAVTGSCAWLSPRSAGSRVLATCLASSTTNWSKALMPHATDCTYTLCSYMASSAPSEAGVSESSRMVVLGRPPG